MQAPSTKSQTQFCVGFGTSGRAFLAHRYSKNSKSTSQKDLISVVKGFGTPGGEQLSNLVYENHTGRNCLGISNRGRIANRFLGCPDCFVCLAMRRDSDSVGRLERWAMDCRHCYRESLCRYPLRRPGNEYQSVVYRCHERSGAPGGTQTPNLLVRRLGSEF
jgi:hypothetical protein